MSQSNENKTEGARRSMLVNIDKSDKLVGATDNSKTTTKGINKRKG